MEEWENIVLLNVQSDPDTAPRDIVSPFLALMKVCEQKFSFILMLGLSV
jgi:hypothetical protein